MPYQINVKDWCADINAALMPGSVVQLTVKLEVQNVTYSLDHMAQVECCIKVKEGSVFVIGPKAEADECSSASVP